MQLQSILLAILTLGATLPGALARDSKWHPVLQVWDIGGVPAKPNQPNEPFSNVGSCGPNIKEGGWGCGRFPIAGSAPRVIYRCTNGKLQKRETCRAGTKNDMCVRNSRRKGKALNPFVAADQLVCVQKKDA
jgi:hypothetical protein